MNLAYKLGAARELRYPCAIYARTGSSGSGGTGGGARENLLIYCPRASRSIYIANDATHVGPTTPEAHNVS